MKLSVLEIILNVRNFNNSCDHFFKLLRNDFDAGEIISCWAAAPFLSKVLMIVKKIYFF